MRLFKVFAPVLLCSSLAASESKSCECSQEPHFIEFSASDYAQTIVTMDKRSRKVIGDALERVKKLRIVANEWTTDKTSILLVPYATYVDIVKRLPAEKSQD